MPLFLLPFTLCLVPALPGCAGDNRTQDDPLLGGPPPQPRAPAQVSRGPAPGPAAPAGGVPALPTATSALSTASLAGGTPLPGGRELRIGETQGTLLKNTNSWTSPGQAQNQGTVLQHPEPVVPPTSRSTLDPVQGMTQQQAGRSGFVQSPGSYEQLQAELRARGMNWYRQEKWGEGVKFSCTVPRPNEPKVRFYEAVAATDVAAMQQVLEKIDEERR